MTSDEEGFQFYRFIAIIFTVPHEIEDFQELLVYYCTGKF